jgi:hypothetical protein
MNFEIILLLSFFSLLFSGKVLTLADEELRKSQSILQARFAKPVRPDLFAPVISSRDTADVMRGIPVLPIKPTTSSAKQTN